MAKNLTDVDTFPANVTVPEGTDSRNDAAGDVELLAQQLANRTFNLKGRLDTNDTTHARRNAANTFTAGLNTFNAGVALAGGDLTSTNDDIVLTNGDVTLTNGTLNCDGDARFSQALILEGTIDASYSSSRARSMIVPLSSFARSDVVYSSDYIQGTGTPGYIEANLELPNLAVVTSVDVIYSAPSAGDVGVVGSRITGSFSGSGAWASNAMQSGGGVSNLATATFASVELISAVMNQNNTIARAVDSARIGITLQDSDVYIWLVRVNFNQPAPRAY